LNIEQVTPMLNDEEFVSHIPYHSNYLKQYLLITFPDL